MWAAYPIFDQAVNALTNVRAGRIKARAVMAKTRLDSAPDIPTVDEAGLPGFYMSVWNALYPPIQIRSVPTKGAL